MHKVYIGLGSNLNQPLEQLNKAVQTLSQLSELNNLVVSTFYQSKPVGPQDQPDFVNAVASFLTNLSPLDVLNTLQNIEQDHNRVRERHWGPRTLDLDLLLYDNEQINLPRLTVPHPLMLERGFVIKPLADLAPDLQLSNGATVSQHLDKLDTSDLVPIHR